MNVTIPANDDRVEQLLETEIHSNPLIQFQKWFDEAVAAQVYQAEAMALTTATPEGKSAARMVLLKGVDDHSFLFYTNYESRKGQALAINPWASLLFWWNILHRQVRIEGTVSQLTAVESDAYFATRPRGSQLSVWASHQSEVVNGRESLENAFRRAEIRFAGEDVPRPSYWGGYRLMPVSLEFWQGRRDRLHDRLRYNSLGNGRWQVERLAP